MQKVYLLLRNNSQSGPFNIDELLQHDLRPTDLVWEEGKSIGWSHPYEIASLKSIFHTDIPVTAKKEAALHKPDQERILHSDISDMDTPFASRSVTSKNVYVSLPHTSWHNEESREEPIEETLEQKAEAIRRRALASIENQSSHTEYNRPEKTFELETKFAKTTGEIGEDYSAWLYTRQIEKKRRARKSKSFAIGLITLVIFAIGLVLFRGNIFNAKDSSTTKEYISEKPENRNTRIKQEVAAPELSGEPNIVEQSLDSVKSSINPENLAIKPLKKIVSKQKKSSNLQVQDSVIPSEGSASQEITQAEDATANQLPEKTEEVPSVAEAPKKKESLGNKIENFFGKFKNKQKNNKPDNRQSKSENKTDEPAPVIDLANQVSVTANTSAGNWMMGVQGLRLTLHNKSNEVVKTATVEVRYYNDEKKLLEKKTVQFNNVSPRKSQTVAAPNHRLADHADYELISAIAKEDGYVKQ